MTNEPQQEVDLDRVHAHLQMLAVQDHLMMYPFKMCTSSEGEGINGITMEVRVSIKFINGPRDLEQLEMGIPFGAGYPDVLNFVAVNDITGLVQKGTYAKMPFGGSYYVWAGWTE